MANSELYRPINSIRVEGFTHSEVQGVRVPSRMIPIKDGHIPQFSCLAVREDFKGNSSKKPFSKLRQISFYHGRSYEFPVGEKGEIIFSDEYENIYTSLTTKGNNLTSSPLITKEGNTPSGFRFHGLQDSDSMVRALRASEIMRSNGISTELFVKVIEPLEIPYKDEMIALDEFKKRLVQQVWEENVSSDDDSERPTRLDIPDLVNALNNMTFFITVRGMQVPERINDLLQMRSEEDLKKIVNRALSYTNLEEQKKAQIDPSYRPIMHTIADNGAEAMRDFIVYYTFGLPKVTAENIAKMHKLGLVHKYLHTANISTVGSIYDLDSVQGEPLGLGDPPITKEDTIIDTMEFIYGYAGWPVPFELASGFRVEEGGSAADLFRGVFIDTYAREMGYVGNIEHFGDIAKLCKDFDDKEHLGALSFYLDEVFEQQNIDFEYYITPQEVAEFMAAKIPVKHEDKIVNESESTVTEGHTHPQAIPAASIFYRIVDEDFEEYCAERGFDKQVSEEQLETFIDFFRYNSLMKVNEATIEIWNQLPEGGDEELFWKKRAEEYDSKPKSEAMKWFEVEFFKELIREWGWEDNLSANLDKIKKLYEENGVEFESDLVDYYLELSESQKGKILIWRNLKYTNW